MEFRDCKIRLRGVTIRENAATVVGQSGRHLSRAPAKLYLWRSSGAPKPDAAYFCRHAVGFLSRCESIEGIFYRTTQIRNEMMGSGSKSHWRLYRAGSLSGFIIVPNRHSLDP